MGGASKNRQAKEHDDDFVEPDSSVDTKASSTGTGTLSFSSEPADLPSGLDGNRDPEDRTTSAPGPSGRVYTVRNKNLDLGLAASYLLNGDDVPSNLPKRGPYNKTGKEVNIRLNTFNVVSYPTKPVYQYDVTIGSGTEKRGLMKRIWMSGTLQKALGDGWLFDGNKLAWSMKDEAKGERRLLVDLDADAGKTPRIDKKTGQPKPDTHRVVIKQTKQVDFITLRTYLDGKCDFSNEILETINFLDHLMREQPSRDYTQIKRNFFARGEKRTLLGGGIEAFKGVYSSIRMVNIGEKLPAGLSVNVDVANTTFWTETRLDITAMHILNANDRHHLANMIGAGRSRELTNAFVNLRKLKKLWVWTPHRPETRANPYCIDHLINKTAREQKFKTIDKKTGVEKEISVEQYFHDTYDIILEFPLLPVVQMTKANIIVPMELCTVKENQRYGFKLSDKQTSEMIKFAVTIPDDRWKSIQHGLNMLKWEKDTFMATYGLKISPTPATVKGRLLPNPKVAFGRGASEDPGRNGRWDLRGKVFHGPHAKPLVSWGISISPGRFAVSKDQINAFIATFIKVFTGHGGKVTNKSPTVLQGSDTPSKDVEALHNTVGNTHKQVPQLLIFVVPDKDSGRYLRIKKSCDCRFGIVSQVLQSSHVQKAQAQYCSNVSMKVNAKLGGYTALAAGKSKAPPRPTMIIGGDVSHAAPGTAGASIASFTASWDKTFVKYCASVQTNGSRVEIITKYNVMSMLGPMLRRWASEVGGGSLPAHIMYFRDGVSEGQFKAVLEEEVEYMRELLLTINPRQQTNFTVLIASKRHHIRFFPDMPSGDRNGNPFPGTLVETGVTHPYEYDFYLCAHAAIKGTARPVHYYVLRDQQKMGVEELQTMIYEHSYQFVRSTTPVSMFPAVYYAHLAAGRGLSHIDAMVPSSGQTEGGTPKPLTETAPLLPMPPKQGIEATMWYV